MHKKFIFLLFIIFPIIFNNTSYGSVRISRGPTPWFIDHIGASRCWGLSTGKGSMVMIIDDHINPFAISNSVIPLKGKVYYIDVEGNSFFDQIPSTNNAPNFHATAIAGLIVGEHMQIPYKYSDDWMTHIIPLPISGVAPEGSVVYVGTSLTNNPFYSLLLNSVYTFEVVKNFSALDKDGKKRNVFNPKQLTNLINLSAGDTYTEKKKNYYISEESWKEALKIAKNENTLLIVAAGNDGVDFDVAPLDRHDLILISIEPDEELDLQNILNRYNPPILIKQDSEFTIYGIKDGKWQETNLNGIDIAVLNNLPFSK